MSELRLYHIERAAQEQLKRESVDAMDVATGLRDIADRVETGKFAADWVEFTCIDCEEHISRPRHNMDIDGLTPKRCAQCTFDRMAEP